MSDHQKYWLGFSLIPELGPKRIAHLGKHFGSVQRAWNASEAALAESGLDRTPLGNLLRLRGNINLDAEIDRVRKAGAWMVTLEDDAYPESLREIADPPPVLYVRGTLTTADRLALSIVGTRKPTSYGKSVTYRLAQHLTRQGITIISGLAHGIDAVAHQGALEAGGRTIAVLGSGIDIIYPTEHAKLAARIVECGALVSEFFVGTPPEGRNFPRRNRIISGMALGVLVTEAPEHSGALITATVAGEQGREVFAVPSNVFNPSGRGTNRLIQDGAKLVMRVSDILDELHIVHRDVETRTVVRRVAPENETEARLLQHMSADPIHIDELIRLTGLSTETVTSTLTILELKGLAQNVGHMQYSRVID